MVFARRISVQASGRFNGENAALPTFFKQTMREVGLRQRTAWAVVTYTLVAMNFVSWGVVAWFYGLPLHRAHHSFLLLRVGAVNGDLLWAGEWWRIITSQFLHVYFAHLVFNMAALIFLGAALEREFGSIRFALIYILSGSIGQIVGVVATPALVTSGASQAVMGIAGAMAINLLRRRESRTSRLIILLAVVGIQLGLDIVVARTIKAGHWSGLCAGAITGYTLIASCRSCSSPLRLMVTKPITRNEDSHERPLDYNELRHH